MGSDEEDGILLRPLVIALVDVKEDDGDEVECDEDPLEGKVYAFDDILQHY